MILSQRYTVIMRRVITIEGAVTHTVSIGADHILILGLLHKRASRSHLQCIRYVLFSDSFSWKCVNASVIIFRCSSSSKHSSVINLISSPICRA